MFNGERPCRAISFLSLMAIIASLTPMGSTSQATKLLLIT